MGEPAVGPVTEVVEVEHLDTREFADADLDVAGHRDVDDVQRVRRGTGRGDERVCDDGFTGSGAGHDDIGSSDGFDEPVESDGDAADPLGQ